MAFEPSSPAHSTGQPTLECSSRRITLAPDLAAYLAAMEPAGPAPMTATSQQSIFKKEKEDYIVSFFLKLTLVLWNINFAN
jgi:hypothetical protein